EVDRTVLVLPGADPLHGILEHGPRRVLDHPALRRNLRLRTRLHKNFRHVPSSTGEPLVRRPYTYEVSPSKGSPGKISCITPDLTAFFPAMHASGRCRARTWFSLWTMRAQAIRSRRAAGTRSPAAVDGSESDLELPHHRSPRSHGCR